MSDELQQPHWATCGYKDQKLSCSSKSTTPEKFQLTLKASDQNYIKADNSISDFDGLHN